METISVDREYGAPERRVRSVLENVTEFFDAAGFEVDCTDNGFELSKRVAVTQFELHVNLYESESATLAYEQISGPFEEMMTHYHVKSSLNGSCLNIETSFDPPTTGFGAFLNRAVVKRQRQAELDAVASLLEAQTEPSIQKSNSHPIETGGD
jgi:hypothetical protein